MDTKNLTADILAYSQITQLAIALGKLVGSEVRAFVTFLRLKNGEPTDNATLDAITRGVLEQDTVRKALADREAEAV